MTNEHGRKKYVGGLCMQPLGESDLSWYGKRTMANRIYDTAVIGFKRYR